MRERYRPSEKERKRKRKKQETAEKKKLEINKKKKEKDRQKDDKQYQALRSYPAKRSPTSTKIPKGAISKRDRLRTPPNDAVPARGGVSGSRKP